MNNKFIFFLRNTFHVNPINQTILALFFLLSCRVDRPILVETQTVRVQCNFNEYRVKNLCEDEKEYLDWAKDSYKEYPKFENLNQKVLKQIADDTEDVDKATSVFYQRLLEEKNTKKFLTDLASLEKKIEKTKYDYKNKNIKLSLVPGMFYKDNPEVQAKGDQIQKIANELNIEVETIAINHVGTVDENAETICNYLKNNPPDEKIIFASPSKGSSDIKRSIQICGKEEYYKKVIGWFSISGILRGSYIIENIENSWRNYIEARSYFFMKGYSWNSMSSLKAGEGKVLDSDFKLPENITAISLVAVPIYRHVTERAKPFFLSLVPHGPNDGFTLLFDSIVPGSYIYPAWRNDHYHAYGFHPNTIKAFMIFLIEENAKPVVKK